VAGDPEGAQVKGAAALAIILSLTGVATAHGETLLTLTPRPGATLRVLVDKPPSPIGSVILLAGDDGVLNLDQQGNIGSNSLSLNFLVRTRASYVTAGYAVFVPDIATDLKGTSRYRFGIPHAQDLEAVVGEARKIAPAVAVVGTSRGAISVVDVFAKGSGPPANALVISSGVLLDHDKYGSAGGVGSLDRIRVPVLLLRHAQDFCKVTPPGDADKFKTMLTAAPKVDVVTMTGGGPSTTFADPCGALHYHGFSGIEDQTVAATVNWLKANMK
jgi:dienelactone hydrolase